MKTSDRNKYIVVIGALALGGSWRAAASDIHFVTPFRESFNKACACYYPCECDRKFKTARVRKVPSR